jgi:L-2,4-diaminobutyrate decarboxylase
LHEWNEETERLAAGVLAYTTERLHLRPVPLDGPRSNEDLTKEVGATVTPAGIGGEEALRVFAEVLAPACISIDHPRYFSFIPCAPTPASTLFDLVVGASSIYGGSWMEGAGAVYAENQALAWLSTLAGLPEGAGGVFVQGGTLANLSALVTARHATAARRRRDGLEPARRYGLLASTEAHSSVTSAAAVMDVEVIGVEPDDALRLTGAGLEAALEKAAENPDVVPFAVVATAGTTNLGIIDELSSVAEVAKTAGLWLHVDGAYGGAAMAAPSRRHLFEGVEWADSLVVDPHKWLFSPFDCAALVYRQPELAKAAHSQHASYLEPLRTGVGEWSPSDYAFHLTRRARGLPFWFSLASYGTDAYAEAIEHTLQVAAYAADKVQGLEHLELICDPMLSVVAFYRRGWEQERYYEWSAELLRSGTAFVVPTTHQSRTAIRLAIVNPVSSEEDIDIVLDSLA